MRSLSAAIASWEPGIREPADPLDAMRAQWPAIVGQNVAAHSRPEQIVRDALLIVTRSGAWSQQLSFLNETILQALQTRTGVHVQRLRFRVGRLNAPSPVPARTPRQVRRARTDVRGPAPTLRSALERFQSDVVAAQRAKARAGWKECNRCGVRIVPIAGPFCTPCENARVQERDARVARLLFEAPWLGYAGIAPLTERLTPQEYAAIRLRVLRHWRDALERIKRAGRAHGTRDRMIASSYVLLKSELDPERIAPVVVRELLGDELHDILYGNDTR